MISLQHVTKVYRNGTTALEDVTVEVEKSEFVFIVGQSGSGKSTFIRLLLKEEEATKGDIYVAGKNLACRTSVVTSGPSSRTSSSCRTRRCSRTSRSRSR
jgi:ABC-type ATPase involved in cell division